MDDTVGDRVRKARKRRRMTQEELAEQAEVTRGYIADLESGAVTDPRNPAKLRQLAEALDVSFGWLAAPTGWVDEVASPDWEAALMADPRFSDDEKQAILTLGRAALSARERKSA